MYNFVEGQDSQKNPEMFQLWIQIMWNKNERDVFHPE